MNRHQRLQQFIELKSLATRDLDFPIAENYNELEGIGNDIERDVHHEDTGILDYHQQEDDNLETRWKRIKLVQTETNTSLVQESFSIMEQVKYFVQEMNNPRTALESDDSATILEGSIISKGEWAREFKQLSNKYLLSKEAENGILNLIYNTLGKTNSNLPITLTAKGRKNFLRNSGENEILSAENVVSDVKKYSRKVSRWIQFDQCENDCCVFVGNLDTAYFCPTCDYPRFRPCTRSECKGKGTDTCTHLRNDDGIAWKSFYYRMLIPLIVDLINTKCFVSALHYQNETMESGTGCRDFYSDILDGEVAKEHLNSMVENFKAWCNETKNNATSIPINLLFMQFYDGGQLFKYATCNFWGLFTSILNLPPTYRGKVGISQFLSAIYGGTHGNAEKFLFTDLYCEELRSLYEGFEYVSPSGKRYFIQARLIFHSMDTKALEPILCMHSASTSRYGCPYCRNAHGQHNSWKVCFTGHRNFLPPKHYFRFFGQSGECCPIDFYTPTVVGNWFVDEQFIDDQMPITAESLLENLHGRAKRLENMKFCEPCDGDEARGNSIKRFLLDTTCAYDWIHKENGFDFKDISKDGKGIRDHIFYRHFDFRQQIVYRRITKEEHMIAALKARELNKSLKVKVHVEGFQDVWTFDRLPYADLPRNSSPPPDHAIKGVIKHCLDYMFGFYKEKKPSRRKYGKKGQTNKKGKKGDENDTVYEREEDAEDTEEAFNPIYRPCYYGKRAPYSCTETQLDRINGMLKCVLIPVGVSDRSDWVLDLHKSGDFKIAQWKILASVYWDYIIHCLSEVNEWYRLFYRMVGNAIRNLLSFRVRKDSIDQLQGEINELVCFWESLYPASENYYQLHQIIDLVSSIPLFGSMHSWSDLLGEKALGYLKKIKKKSNPGGTSYEKNIMERHVDREISTFSRFYSEPVNNTDKKTPNYKTKVMFDEEHNILKFKAAQFAIEDPKLDQSSFCELEVNFLVEVLLKEVRKRYNGDEELCIKNSYLYSAIYNSRIIYPTFTFFQLLEAVADNDDCYPEEEGRVAQSLLSFKPTFHSTAWIYGLKFRSRGSYCREYLNGGLPQRVRPNADFFSAREVLSWDTKDNYSSWCMFQQSDFNLLPSPDAYRYGRINAFFEIRIGDSSIDGLLLASITSHRYNRIVINVDIVNKLESLDPHTIFVALQDIYPTLIATIPIGPNLLPNKLNRKKIKKIQYINLFTRDLQLKYSIMLKMNPDKLSCFPNKRPWTIYLSSSSNSCSTKGTTMISAKPSMVDNKSSIDFSSSNTSSSSCSSSSSNKSSFFPILSSSSNVVTSAQSSSSEIREQQTIDFFLS